MKFNFIGMNNIDKKLVKRISNKYVLRNGGRSVFKIARDWTINVYPSYRASENPFFYGDGVGGVTGKGVINMYLYDVKTSNMTSMASWMALTHELAHMILIIQGRKERVPLRNDDYGGNKAGKKLNYSTAEVHDRDIENKTYTERIFRFPRWYYFRALDFRDHKK